MLDSIFPQIVFRSMLGSVLILVLLGITFFGRNRIAPKTRFLLWLLVPLILLFFVPVPMPPTFSLQNYLPFDLPRLQQEQQESNLFGKTQSRVNIPQKTKPKFVNPFDDETTDAPVTEKTNITDENAGEDKNAGKNIDENDTAPSPVVPGQHRGGVFSFKSFAYCWGGGVALFYGCLLLQILRFRRLIHNGTVVTDQRVLRIFEGCKKIMRVKTWIMLIESSKVPGPFLVGVFRPVIVVPQGLVHSLNPEELRHLFYHELAHLKRSDLITGWVMILLLGLYWFNPLVWIAVRVMNHLREEASDCLVLEHLEPEQKFDYGTTLLTLSREFAKPQFVPGIAGILETRSFLQRRIEMITKPTVWKKSWSIPATSICVLLALTLLTNAKPQEEKEKEKEALPNANYLHDDLLYQPKPQETGIHGYQAAVGNCCSCQTEGGKAERGNHRPKACSENREHVPEKQHEKCRSEHHASVYHV